MFSCEMPLWRFYEYFVFEESNLVAGRDNHCYCVGFGIQLSNDQSQQPRTARLGITRLFSRLYAG
jgi:hypothetical protein